MRGEAGRSGCSGVGAGAVAVPDVSLVDVGIWLSTGPQPESRTPESTSQTDLPKSMRFVVGLNDLPRLSRVPL